LIGLNLTLFGLVLAVGIVVDDAIVVVENVERHLAHGMSRAMRRQDHGGGRRAGPIALVLCAVFVPTAFSAAFPGSSSSNCRHHCGRDGDCFYC
jgi:multidrug efflux pump subunit AcrB